MNLRLTMLEDRLTEVEKTIVELLDKTLFAMVDLNTRLKELEDANIPLKEYTDASIISLMEIKGCTWDEAIKYLRTIQDEDET